MNRIRIYLLILLIGLWGIALYPFLNKKLLWIIKSSHKPASLIECVEKKLPDNQLQEAMNLLKVRKDKQAMEIFEMVLLEQPDNLDALWGKAEVLRRIRKYKESQNLLNGILEKNSNNQAALLSLAYIRYKEGNLDGTKRMVEGVLKSDCL